MKYDYLIVGAGLFGCTFARIVAEKGKKVLILEKRNHIGGNCYTEKIEGINVHKYGAHIFHTNDKKIWNFINKFSEFNNYQHVLKVNYKNKIYSFPINLMTLYQIWGVKTPKEAETKINEFKTKNKNKNNNLEDWIKSEIGEELYEIFIKGYTLKQWNKQPKELPSSIIKRLPIRYTYDDRYFKDKYQGIPTDGYTAIFEKMIDHSNIKVEYNLDFFDYKNIIKEAKKIVYTGKIDEFFEYSLGELEYRSLRFENKILDKDFQGVAVMNYTEENIPYTRIIEHKHFEFKNTEKTVVTFEYPDNYNSKKVPYYPINDKKNNLLYESYKKMNKNNKIIFGGRLGKYEYKDMHQIIASATIEAKKSLNFDF